MKYLTTLLRLSFVSAIFAVAAFGGPFTGFANEDTIDIEILSVDDSAFPEVQVVMAVTSGGRPFVDFVNGSVTVTEGSLAAQVNTVVRAIDGDLPLSVVLAIDTSGSMAGLSIEQAKQAASSLVGSLAEQEVTEPQALGSAWIPFDVIPLPFREITADAQQERRITHGQTVLIRDADCEEGDWIKLVDQRNQLIAVGSVVETIGDRGVGVVRPRIVFR